MPQANGKLWRRCRARMDITSNQAAELLGIKGGSLRQIETGAKPASLALAFRAERLYGVPVDELLIDADSPSGPQDPKPNPDKDKPKVERVSPPGRRNGKTNQRGPRRVSDKAVA